MKIKIAIFFSILFLNLIFTPVVLSWVDDNQELSIYFDTGEEEKENKGEESIKDLKIKIQSSEDLNSSYSQETFRKKNVRFKSKKYTATFSKINTPPPELTL